MSYQDKLKPIAPAPASTGYASKLKPMQSPVVSNPAENKPGLFSVATLKGDTTYKADEGGAGAILPNIARTIGNVPSSAAKVFRAAVAPVNPLDTDSPLNIGSNLTKSVITLHDMVKDRKAKDVVKDTVGGVVDTAKNAYGIFKGVGEKIYNNLETNVKGENSVLKGVGVSAAQAASKVAKTGIEDPLLIPSLLTGGGEGDAVGDTAKIFTRKVDTSIPALTKKILPSKAGAIDNLEDTYTELMSGTTAGKKKVDKLNEKTVALDRAGTSGRTPQRTLAESGVIPRRNGPKLDTYEQAKEYRATTAPLREANRAALKEVGLSSSPVKLDDLEAKAIANAKTPQNVNGGRFNTMEKQIKDRFSSLRNEYPSGEIPLSTVDDIKSAHWDNVFGNKSLVEADRLAKDSDYAIAKAAQKNIEEIAEKAGHKDVAQLNREIGDRLDAAKYLEDLNGKTIKGGRLLKYISTGIGSAMGNTIPGKIIGAFGGNVVGELIIANNVASPIKRFLLRNLQAKDPAAYTKTIEWLSKQNLDRETRLLLPEANKSASTINEGRPIRVLPPEKVMEVTSKDTVAGRVLPAKKP